jgi:aryl-alcohol dehydrogenase-like predicted oxidoreductase
VIERRRLGRTGLDVSVLGFGGSEIGFERADVATVRRLLADQAPTGAR